MSWQAFPHHWIAQVVDAPLSSQLSASGWPWCGDWRIGLSVWHFWHGPEGTGGIAADALSGCAQGPEDVLPAMPTARLKSSRTMHLEEEL
jgi:hypothetical protein